MADLRYASMATLPRMLMLTHAAGIPAAMVSPVGLGKTSISEALYLAIKECVDHPFHYWKCFLGLWDATDIGGFPREDGDRIAFKMMRILPWDCDDHGLVVFDEYDNASPDLQNASTQILLGGNIHDHYMSPNAYMMLTMNGSSDQYTTRLSKKVRNRVCFFYLHPQAQGMLTAWNRWANKNDIDPIVRAFTNFDRSEYDGTDTDGPLFEDLGVDSPRSRERVSQVLAASRQVDFDTDDIMFEVLQGIAGHSFAVKFMAFIERVSELSKVEDILRHGIKNNIDFDLKDPSTCWAVGSAVIKNIKEGEFSDKVVRDRAANGIALAEKFSPDIGYWLASSIVHEVPDVTSTNEYQIYFNKHQEIII